jgi:hypothetical protein
LVEYYALCDGGNFFCYEFLPLRRIIAEASSLRGFPDRPDPGAEIRHLLLGFDADGWNVIWDSRQDEILLYDPDGQSVSAQGSFARFIDKVFAPQLSADKVPDLWVTLLQHLDSLAELGEIGGGSS